MGLYSGGLIIGRIFASEIYGAYFREGLLILFYSFFFGGGGGGLLSEFYGMLVYRNYGNGWQLEKVGLYIVES